MERVILLWNAARRYELEQCGEDEKGGERGDTSWKWYYHEALREGTS